MLAFEWLFGYWAENVLIVLNFNVLKMSLKIKNFKNFFKVFPFNGLKMSKTSQSRFMKDVTSTHIYGRIHEGLSDHL